MENKLAVVSLGHEALGDNTEEQKQATRVAAKVLALGGKNKMKPEFMMTGGVAKNLGVVKEIEELLGDKLNVPDEPEILGALGAALIAAEI